MISKWQWFVVQASRMLWVRAALFALLGVGAALLATLSDRLWPGEAPVDIGADAVGVILGILASSMLAVTTFSLTVMVSTYGMATANITPRATRLLLQDTTSQNVLGTFLGSFLFSLVGIIALNTEIYGEKGRMVLFIFTMLVILVIVITMLRWIDHLSSFGRMADAAGRVENVILKALRSRADNPRNGTSILYDPQRDIPPSAKAIHPSMTGYIQHIDIEKLSAWAEKHDGQVFLIRIAGSFVHPLEPIAWVMSTAVDAPQELASAVTIGALRSFDQDPRFGIEVLAEIASRALSPAVNDPGTAIDVLGRAVRILSHWADETATATEPMGTMRCSRVHVPPLLLDDLFADIFTPIARDGAAMVEVQVRLQKSLKMLAGYGGEFFVSASKYSAMALARAELAMPFEDDRFRLRSLASQLGS
ncbi:MAG TPA: DUF2254 domain-containing protein [Pseudomonas xinjiangensis]|uniref:DUF2254 domain-containing protein n=2 Tax=root TaxID=1 RepID=A0A7V1BLR5_9GAMM|nr:DUF2254 domain-containing protein [Halopseudomonas xinjiangensis]HEC47033.1 DUF2254 domain-containing protein [Halopseudomonas xinjiangensis]